MDTKVPVPDALHMSLDEYISEAGISDPTLLLSNGHNGQRHRSKYRQHNAGQLDAPVKEEEQEQEQEAEDEDEDVEMGAHYGFGEDLPSSRSQQWRLLPPNVQANRPSGMPPLMPIDAAEQTHNGADTSASAASTSGHDLTIEVDNNKVGQQRQPRPPGRRWTYRDHRNNRNHNNNNNRNQQHHNNNGGQNAGGNRHNHHNGGANAGVQRPDNQFKANRLSVHQRIDYTYLNRRQHQQFHQQQPQPQRLNPASFTAGLAATIVQNDLDTAAMGSAIAAANLGSNNSTALAAATNATAANELALPAMAFKLLEQIDAMQRAKMDKKYDMKVQKEISKLQNKPLMYTCPGAAVISSDGPGVEAEELKPHATDVSMNHRFA